MTIVELRQYTLHPGRRDELIELFEREFVESQESLGMRVIGTFRDLRDPDRFVWVRGFPDMVVRKAALASFYGGPVWREHGPAANATMIDSDDVLLLRPAGRGELFGRPPPAPPGPDAEEPSTSLVLATVWLLHQPVDEALLRFFDTAVRPVLTACGGTPRACLRTEEAENTFPQLPVRAGEHALAWFTPFSGQEQWSDYQGELERSLEWNAEVVPRLAPRLRAAQRLRLEPTARSLFR